MSLTFNWQNPNDVLLRVQQIIEAQHGKIRRVPEMAVRAGAFELQSRIQSKLPKKTVTLARSVAVKFERGQGNFLARIGSPLAYAAYVEYGTGIYGPKGQPIVPKTAKALRWSGTRQIASDLKTRRAVFASSGTKSGRTMQPRLADQFAIFRKSVRGMRPRPVFREETTAFVSRFTQIIERELAREISK